jgi:thioredoxin reductase/ferredoxin
MLTYLVWTTFGAVILLVAAGVGLYFRRERENRVLFEETLATGMSEVPSLHPVVDAELCISSGACVDACPEDVLGQVDGKTHLIQPGSCIGHGLCQSSCPTDAITLVFGTAKRGVDIPLLRRGYESNVDGIFVVGELGGMGLLRNTLRQGQQAVASIQETLADPLRADPDTVDVLIVGGGPAGISCALKCKEQGLSFKILEQFTMGGSVSHYPRRKLIHSEVVPLPLVGKFGKREMLKEEMIAEFERCLLEADISILEHRRVDDIQGRLGAFIVNAQGPDGLELHRARTVVLAIGRRGTPRRLLVPGEESQRVVYRLLEPEMYRHRKVLVVGGGDSAVEAAVSVSHMAGSAVHLSYRKKAFFRVKKNNRQALEQAVTEGRVTLHLETNVIAIGQDEVALESPRGRYKIEVQDLIVSIGGVLPRQFLDKIGIEVETKHGEALQVETPSQRLAKSVATKIARASTRIGNTLSGSSQPGSGSKRTRAKRTTRRQPPAES